MWIVLLLKVQYESLLLIVALWVVILQLYFVEICKTHSEEVMLFLL